MLTKSKQKLLLDAIKLYHKRYLKKHNPELDESGTRLMINSFLTDVLGFAPIEEVKTEQLIRGAYADYVIQLKGKRHFLIEAKKLGIELSEKHLRQARQYCADEGIEFVILTNGKQWNCYKIHFEKPIRETQIFSFDLSNPSNFKEIVQTVQYLSKYSVANKGLDLLWNKCVALDTKNVAGLLHNKPIINFLKRTLTKKYKHKFSDDEIGYSLNRIISESIQLEDVNQRTVRRKKRKMISGGQNSNMQSDGNK